MAVAGSAQRLEGGFRLLKWCRGGDQLLDRDGAAREHLDRRREVGA